MKRVFLVFALAGLIGFTSCKENASDKVKSENVETAEQRDAADMKKAVISFEETEHDFGKIPQGQSVEKLFKFKNTGDAPLVITNARSSCGCTVPEWPREPIAPGDSGELLVKFNGSGKNQVTKIVTITANTAKGTENIRIKAFVEPKEAAK